MSETIIAAAIQVEGVTLSLPQPARHGQVLQASDIFLLEGYVPTQGFLTSTGRFVNRVQAKQIAHIAKQPIISDQQHDRDLFSEDLW